MSGPGCFGFAQHIWGGPIPYTLRWADPSITSLEVNNRALIFGLDDIQGYNPVHLARYDEFMAALNGHPQNYHHTDVFDTGLDSPLLDVLNVRYIVVPPDEIESGATTDEHGTRWAASDFAVDLGSGCSPTNPLSYQIDLPQPAAYAYAGEVMSANAQAADAQEGMRAFLEKRPAVWKGR